MDVVSEPPHRLSNKLAWMDSGFVTHRKDPARLDRVNFTELAPNLHRILSKLSFSGLDHINNNFGIESEYGFFGDFSIARIRRRCNRLATCNTDHFIKKAAACRYVNVSESAGDAVNNTQYAGPRTICDRGPYLFNFSSSMSSQISGFRSMAHRCSDPLDCRIDVRQ